MESETIYTKEELEEAIEWVLKAKNTSALPAYAWARIAKILLQAYINSQADNDPRHIRIGESVLPISYREVKRK